MIHFHNSNQFLRVYIITQARPIHGVETFKYYFFYSSSFFLLFFLIISSWSSDSPPSAAFSPPTPPPFILHNYTPKLTAFSRDAVFLLHSTASRNQSNITRVRWRAQRNGRLTVHVSLMTKLSPFVQVDGVPYWLEANAVWNVPVTSNINLILIEIICMKLKISGSLAYTICIREKQLHTKFKTSFACSQFYLNFISIVVA